MRLLALRIGLLVGCLASMLGAQAPPQPGPSFEAASLKRAAANATPAIEGGPGTADPGRVRYSGLPLRLILQYCWGIKASQIVGPDWLDKDTFELSARLPPDTTKEQFQLMLQRLLAERMGLKFHQETRNLNGYELVVAKGGIKLQPSTPPADGKVLAPSVDSMQDPKARANTSIATTLQLATGLKRVSAHLQTSLQIARMCAGYLDGDGGVIDKTGLTGRYDFNLDFAPAGPRGPRMTPEQTAAMPTPDGPDFATAVRQQLGLQLIPVKVPTDSVVIDHVERVPAEN